MTLVIYEPDGPALEFIGHAGAGPRGQDPVCAALSILLYTLIEAVPAARVSSGDGYCRVDGGRAKSQNAAERLSLPSPRPLPNRSPAAAGSIRKRKKEGAERASSDAAFAVILGGLRLLAANYPQNVRLVEKGAYTHETGDP